MVQVKATNLNKTVGSMFLKKLFHKLLYLMIEFKTTQNPKRKPMRSSSTKLKTRPNVSPIVIDGRALGKI